MFKFVVFAVALGVVSCKVLKPEATERDRIAFQVAHKKCQMTQETKAEEELVRKLLQGEFVEDESLKKHMLCMSILLKVMHDNGTINVEYLKETFNEYYDGEQLQRALDCIKEYATPVETSWEVIKCKHRAAGFVHRSDSI
ncbi:unnamed protein product [Brassicogethes aeneus]|uniref:Uncharacterized protein n=1 Tax=Brassicogethes aeneus TaxID=1431903 RepID=A0A9P0FEG0_BRAAE|nr:unnamed protein product [Brassicogethes aeneus]